MMSLEITVEPGSKWVLGVDGGGSKTLAWIARLDSALDVRAIRPVSDAVPNFTILGRGEAGPSNPRSVGFEVAFSNLELAIGAARRELQTTAATSATATSATGVVIAVACFGLAGAGREAEQKRIQEWAIQNAIAERVIVTDDVEPLRLAAEYEQQIASASETIVKSDAWDQSVTLVVGTGSIACGRNRQGGSIRVGGWGYLLGDEGSGFSIGLAALQSICQTHDRNQPMSAFQHSSLQLLGCMSASELVGFVYQWPLPRDRIAKLSRVVVEFSEMDEVARKIIADAIRAMASLVALACNRLALGNEEYSLALSGGVLNHHPALVEHLQAELGALRCSPMSSHVIAEPSYGPLLVAIDAAMRL